MIFAVVAAVLNFGLNYPELLLVQMQPLQQMMPLPIGLLHCSSLYLSFGADAVETVALDSDLLTAIIFDHTKKTNDN